MIRILWGSDRNNRGARGAIIRLASASAEASVCRPLTRPVDSLLENCPPGILGVEGSAVLPRLRIQAEEILSCQILAKSEAQERAQVGGSSCCAGIGEVVVQQRILEELLDSGFIKTGGGLFIGTSSSCCTGDSHPAPDLVITGT